jgi:hypothetical protein
MSRTGPFVPPITFPFSHIVVAETLRRTMEESMVGGITFQPIVKRHIAHVAWDNWEMDADEPRYYPESGEPAHYILEKPHDPDLALRMGSLDRLQRTTWDDEGVPGGFDAWKTPEWSGLLASERLAELLDRVSPDWISVSEE